VKFWRTAQANLRCGFDDRHIIRAGEKYLEIEIGGVRKVRCPICAGKFEVPSETAADDAAVEPAIEEPPS
jgi:hypothetical protein